LQGIGLTKRHEQGQRQEQSVHFTRKSVAIRKETFDVLLLKDRMSRMNLLLESNNPGGGENCVCVCLFRESAALLANFLVLSVSVEEWEIFRIQRI
jgi:hypothetical protein